MLPIPGTRKAASLEDMVQKKRRSSKKSTLEEVMKSRQATTDSNAPPRNATLEKIMMKGNASKGGDSSKKPAPKNAMLKEMMMKPAPPAFVEAPSPIVEAALSSRNAVLEDMM